MQKGLALKIAVICSSLSLLTVYVWYQTRALAVRSQTASSNPSPAVPQTQSTSSGYEPASGYDSPAPILLPGSKSRSALFTSTPNRQQTTAILLPDPNLATGAQSPINAPSPNAQRL